MQTCRTSWNPSWNLPGATRDLPLRVRYRPRGMARPTIVFDIETVGTAWDELDAPTRDYLITRTSRKLVRDSGSAGSAEAIAKEALGLSPGTGRVICIALVNLESDQGAVLYEGNGPGWLDTAAGQTRVYRGDEAGILREFWQLLERYGRVVTYNGRAFDLPFAYVRSALHGIRPSRQLLANRYSMADHCDLAEVLTFFGAAQERFSLDYWCRRFGITSPKEGGLDGSHVGQFYSEGRIDEIAEYCLRDSRATGELFRKIEKTLIDLYGSR